MAVGGLAPALSPDEEEERLRLEAQGMAPPSFDDTMAAGSGGAAPAPPAAPAAPAPAAAPLVVAQPGDVSKTVVTAKAPSAASRQAMGEADVAGRALVDATRREEDAKAEEKKVEAQGNLNVATTERDQAKARQEFELREMERLKNIEIAADKDMVTAKEDVERAYQAQRRGYFADKPWFTGVLAAIAVAASRRNMRIMGENPNASGVQASIDKAIETDLKAKEARYLKSKEYLAEVRARPGEAEKILEKKRSRFVAEQAAELAIVAKEAAKMKASQALDPARVEAEADRVTATAQEKYAEGRHQKLKEYDATTARTDVDPAAGQPGTVTPATMAKLESIKTHAANADRELAQVQAIVSAEGGVPGPKSKRREAYDGAVRRAAKSIALMESGSPDAEASDKTIDSIVQRISRGNVETVAVDAAAKMGLTEGTLDRETSKIASERQALRDRVKAFTDVRGAQPAAAPAPAATPAPTSEKPAAAGPVDQQALLKRYTAAIARAQAAGDMKLKAELQAEMARAMSKGKKR